jgi:hypothetical protein
MSEPKPAESHLGLSLMLDTNTIKDDSEAMEELVQFQEAGWIELARSDVVETEFLNASGDLRTNLESAASRFSEYFGPMVFGHSRWGSSVWGSAQDQDLLEGVFATLFPNRTYGSNPDDLRDAMHVAWATRYGMTALVTRDGAVLKANDRVGEVFNGFSIWSPEKALPAPLPPQGGASSGLASGAVGVDMCGWLGSRASLPRGVHRRSTYRRVEQVPG